MSHRFLDCAALIAAVVGLAQPADAAIVIVGEEVGSNVEFQLTGSLNLASFESFSSGVGGAIVDPEDAGISFGGSGTVGVAPVVGPSSYGTGTTTGANTSPGDVFAFFIFDDVLVRYPDGYQSGDPLTASATYANTTFAGLGITPGAYTWTWNNGAVSDSMTLIVPEPTSLALLGLGGLALWHRRRRAGS
jgi:hypothetical protein